MYTYEPPKRPKPGKPCKIECVTVCAGYADFLAHTLPLNHHHFDRMIVVTLPGDKATRRVCETYGVKYVEVPAMQPQHDRFCKGVGINAGLALLDKDAWLVHLDADIALPAHFRKSVAAAELDTRMIYGADRNEFKSFQDWATYHAQPEPPIQGGFIHTSHASAHTHVRLGTRVQLYGHGTWVPIGFFQLWHADSGVKTYPEGHTDAGREDNLFALKWPRSKRSFLPEIIVSHLESEAATMAVNWAGRQTKPFGPDRSQP